ncbi:sensor histidine kinase [Paraliomyxa miuraensis]|uniref:sensor histidine kinase n=1 Tax=Paraliomyxa miuraensis TaxID=376150 RepID=UPI002253F9C9|nr:ATP-binding protein [Paraliomyxa miuraensis]MCX4246662.1 ATP-binding protein [Paraliomyxa miuraensis]
MVDPATLKPLLDALGTRAGLVDAQGRLRAINAAWRRPGHPLAGPDAELDDDYLQRLQQEPGPLRDDALRVARALRRALDGEAAPALTYRFGSPSQWSRTSVCTLAGSESSRCVVVLHDDVTEQVRAEHALRRSQARLRTILTGAPIVLFSLDLGGTITVVEGMGGAGTGFVSEDLVGSSVFEAYRHMPDLLGVIRDALGGRVGVITQTVGHLAFEIRCSPVLRDERVVGAVGVATDVTERLRAQRMKDEFVSIVSHELRTPLTSIRGSLGLLEGGVAGELPPKARDLVRIARTNSDRLIRLINDILDLDKMEAGHLVLDREVVELGPLVDAVVAEMSGFAQQAGVAVVVETEPSPPVHGDRDRLAQVLVNLISNAIKFSPEGERVTLRVQPGHGRVRLSVVDRGPGIARADVPRLFQKFHQLDASDTRARGGSGLGLVIAKTLIEAHHGHIGVDSDVGRGSTFYVELPVMRSRSGARVTARQSTAGSSDPAVAIDPRAIIGPGQRGTQSLMAELENHVRDAVSADDLDALADAEATARILGSALPPDASPELRACVSLLARALDQAQRGEGPRGADRWAHLQRELVRLRALLPS